MCNGNRIANGEQSVWLSVKVTWIIICVNFNIHTSSSVCMLCVCIGLCGLLNLLAEEPDIINPFGFCLFHSFHCWFKLFSLIGVLDAPFPFPYLNSQTLSGLWIGRDDIEIKIHFHFGGRKLNQNWICKRK